MPKEEDSHRQAARLRKGRLKTLLRWAGDDPTREGLRDTPRRIANAYKDCSPGT